MLLLARRPVPILIVTIQCAVFLPSCGGGPIQVGTSTTPASLKITTTTLPAGTLGQAYSAQLAATGGTTPYTWSITSGQLAAGLSLDATTGAITGTPTQAETSSFTVEVEDSSSPVQTATADLSMTISSSSSSNCTTGQPCGAKAPFCTSYTPPSTSGATAISSLPYKITSSGNYYLTGNLSVPSGDPVGISIQASNVDINLNGYTLTYGAGGSSTTSAVGQFGILSCYSSDTGDAQLASAYETNGFCGSSTYNHITIENGTITQSTQASGYDNFANCPGASVGGNYSPNPCAPGGNDGDTYASTFSHNIGLFFGHNDTIQHVTLNFQNVSSNGIHDDQEQSSTAGETFQCNTINNNVLHIDNRGALEGVSIWGLNNEGGSGDTIQYNTIVGGPQGGIQSSSPGSVIQYNDISIGSSSNPVEYTNDFAIYAGGDSTSSTTRYNYIHNYYGRGVGDGASTTWTETGDYITTKGTTLSYEYNTSAGSNPGCEMNGEMGVILRGTDAGVGGTTETLSGVFSSVSGGACPATGTGLEIGGSYGLSLYQWNGGDSSSNSTYQGHALSGFAGGAGSFGWEATGLGIITSEGTPPFGNFTSTNDTFYGDSSVVYMDWGGLPSGSVTLISPTLVKGSNPTNFNTFRFQNAPPSQGGGNVCSGCFHIRDATFQGGASATDADMSGPISSGSTAEYWIDWTYTLTVTSGGSPVSGASVTIVDALGNTAFTGATNASGQIVAVLTQFRMYNNSTAMVQEERTPDAVTISNSGCTTLNYSVTMTQTTSDSRTLTCQ